jgi:hypothetical protein
MKILFIFIEFILQIFSSWTLAYHFSLITHLPAKSIVIPFLVIWLPMIGLFWQRWLRMIKNSKGVLLHQKQERWFLLGAIILALSTGGFTLIISRPDADDFSFFHRALFQLSHTDLPFFLTNTNHNVPNLPPLSLSHVMTSYEPLVAMTASEIGIDPLWAYQNASAFIVGVILPFVYILLYRQFRLRKTFALVATFFSFLFLILDGNLHRSFGNFALVRCWQGKVILVMLLVPLTFLITHRFLCHPSFRNFSLIFMTTICAVGLSSSGVFMIPILVFGISIAYVLGYGFSLIRIRRAVFLNVASFYGIMIALVFILGVTPSPVDSTAWTQGWPLNWWNDLKLVIGDSTSLICDLLILLVLPIATLKHPLSRFPVLLTIALSLIFANPIWGPFWLEKIQPAAYWRLIYLFPLPWCVGLLANIAIQRDPLRTRVTRIGIGIIILIAIAYAYQFSVLPSPQNATIIKFKSPWELKFSTPELTFARSIGTTLSTRNLLAPEKVVVVLGLLDPNIKFETTRSAETLHVFRNIGKEEEGFRRVAAQNFIGTCIRSPDNESALLESLGKGIDAIIARDCEPNLQTALISLLVSSDTRWREAAHNNGYVLFLKVE